MKQFLKLIGFAALCVVVDLSLASVGLGARAIPAPFSYAGYVAPVPRQQFLDNSGRVLAAGKVYTYAAGTTTLQPTYADATLTTPNANPLTLDGGGRATMYLAQDIGYKFVIKTALDVDVYTQDNVAIPPSSSGGGGNALEPGVIALYGGTSAPSGYLLGDGSAVSRTIYSSLFGAIGTNYGVGNGTTTFNVPDCRGRFPLFLAASGIGSTIGGSGGALDHTHSYTDVLNHTHGVTVTDPGHTHSLTDPGHAHGAFDFVGGGAVGNAIQQIFAGALTSPQTNVTQSATTGITISANTTGISAVTTNPSGGVASGTTAAANPAYLVFQCIVKT